MDGKLISLKRSSDGKDEKSPKSILGGSKSDYPPEARFSLADGQAEKQFGKEIPAHRSPVKFHGKGYIDGTQDDPFGAKKGATRVGVQMTHLCVDCDGEEEGNGAAPKRESLRDTIKRSAKEAGEDLDDEKE